MLGMIAVSLVTIVGCSSKPKKTPPPEPELPVIKIGKSVVEQVMEQYGPVVAERVKYWQQLINTAPQRSEAENLKITNDFFNQARFVDDIEIWNRSDYWATPLEFIIMDAGDCEDFTCAKYFTLKEMGVDSAKLRLVYVKAAGLNKAHMVLAYYPQPSAEPLLLDNLRGRITPASQRQDLTPVYSFDGSDIWVSKSRTQQVKATGKANTLKDWVDWQARLDDGVPILVIPEQ